MNGPEETPRGSQGSGHKRSSSHQIVVEDDSEEEDVVVESKKKHINKSTFRPNNNDDIDGIKPPKRPKRQKNYDISIDKPNTITEESSEVTSPEMVTPSSPISPMKMQAKLNAKQIQLRVEDADMIERPDSEDPDDSDSDT